VALALQSMAEALALDVRHREPQLPGARFAGVEDRDDPGVLEPRDDRDFTAKAIGADTRGEFATQHLECDRTPVFLVHGQVYRGHPAASQLVGYPVSRYRVGLHIGGKYQVTAGAPHHC